MAPNVKMSPSCSRLSAPAWTAPCPMSAKDWPPPGVALTHPARWSDHRTAALREAAAAAGIAEPDLVPEPVAAAAHYAERHVAPGALVAVDDFPAAAAAQMCSAPARAR